MKAKMGVLTPWSLLKIERRSEENVLAKESG